MPLKLVSPGKRGNKVYYVRGSFRGERYEVSTYTTNKDEAEKFKAEFQLDLINKAKRGAAVTYSIATARYVDHADPPKYELRAHDQLCAIFGERLASEVNQHDIFDAAKAIFPKAMPSTRNRWVIKPCAAVLHYAADNKWCPYIRVRRFEEPKPKTRSVTPETARKLLKSLEGKRWLLVLWLFKIGTRISETLTIEGENVDLKTRRVSMYSRKTDTWRVIPIDDELVTAFNKIFPEGLPKGHIFGWYHKENVYRWLRPHCKRLGIVFTPHMARHSVGTWLSAMGASVRLIMDKLGHSDVKSSMRYQNANDEDAIRKYTKDILKRKSQGSRLGDGRGEKHDN